MSYSGSEPIYFDLRLCSDVVQLLGDIAVSPTVKLQTSRLYAMYLVCTRRPRWRWVAVPLPSARYSDLTL